MANYRIVLHRMPELCSALLLFLIAVSTTGEVLKDEEWLLKNENPCSAAGGICVVKKYCEEPAGGNKTELCPEQKADGICCSRVPANASCNSHGGHCTEDCGNYLKNFGKLECTDGNTCCLLIT